MQGIYQIRNIKTGKVYVGSSKNIERRFGEHIRNLKNNKHHSIKLQRSWNLTKDKKKTFVFEVIEEVNDNSILKEREQYYIDLKDAYTTGYNCSEKVDNLKYVFKKQKKVSKKKLLDKLYNEYINLYNKYKDNLDFSYTFRERLEEKHYSYITYKKVVKYIKWFLDNYDIHKYKFEISFTGKSTWCFDVEFLDGRTYKYYYLKKGKLVEDEYMNKLLENANL
ncbi:MAG: GIY-YIG nuclease family protein [Bacilli bacterium]